jgi:hypothetical protein
MINYAAILRSHASLVESRCEDALVVAKDMRAAADALDGVDRRDMEFWVASKNNTRHWRTARGTASACWAVLCGEQEADPLECQSRGWSVLRCVGNAVESDLRFRAVHAVETIGALAAPGVARSGDSPEG